MATDAAVVVSALTREYQTDRKSTPRVALAGLDLTVESGQVHGLLGPNGAGKTTLCKILSTVLLPTSGSASVYGHDVVTGARRVRTLIGLVFGGERGLYTRLSARRNLMYWAALSRVPRREVPDRVAALLDRVGLTDRADERVEAFSRGMKQRLHLARGLIADPKLVILDEPTTGMDPVGARTFRGLVHQLRDEGRTVLITTHDMAEAESVCDLVSLIDEGRLLRTEDPRTVGRWITEHERVDARDVPEPVAASLTALPGVVRVEALEGGTTRIHTSQAAAADVLRFLLDAGVTSVSTAPPSLEEVYLAVIGDRGMRV